MIVSPSAALQMTTNSQFKTSSGESTSDNPFGALMMHLTGSTIDDQTELLATDTQYLAEQIEQMSEEELADLISWIATEFDLMIETNQELIEQLSIIKSSDLTIGEDEDEADEVIHQLVSLLELSTTDIKPFESIQEVSPVIQDTQSIVQVVDSREELDQLVSTESLDYLITQFDSMSQEDAKQLLNELKQMQAANQPFTKVLESLTLNDGDEEPLAVLTKVYDNFAKKATLAQKTSYQTDTTVTSKDIQKWVKAAVEEFNQPKDQSTNTFGELFSQQKTDTQIEQLHIQLGQSTQTNEALSDELLTQFEKAISQSRFTQQLSGDKQLLLKLNPESLGTIRVELTEVDGEMLVKLTASSQMAKEALESNVRELRHMFSPNNIAIEKQEVEPVFVEQQPPHEEMQDDQNLHDQNQQHAQPEQEKTDDEAIRFEDVLFQERV